jgi:hypothetical protein
VVSTANYLINPATILSNHKSTTCVNLLLTCCNYAISTGFHSSRLIRFVGWLYFNLNSHSYNTCRKSQKNTSCKSLNMYLSRYLHGVILGFFLSFCANYISFVLNHISISAFVGFHGLNIPFLCLNSLYAYYTDPIHPILCSSSRQHNHLLVITLSFYFLG